MLFKGTSFAIFSFALVFQEILCRPAVDSGSDPTTICYSLNCPEGTSVCGKLSEVSSEDRTKLNVQLRCYDEDGNILKSKNSTEENPFGPGVYYKGTKYSAVVKLRPAIIYEAEPDEEPDKEEPNTIPIFLNLPSNRIPKTGPKSEVEDLNSR